MPKAIIVERAAGRTRSHHLDRLQHDALPKLSVRQKYEPWQLEGSHFMRASLRHLSRLHDPPRDALIGNGTVSAT